MKSWFPDTWAICGRIKFWSDSRGNQEFRNNKIPRADNVATELLEMGKNMTILFLDLEVWKIIPREWTQADRLLFGKREQIRKNTTLIFSLIMVNSILLMVFLHHHIPFTEVMYEIYTLEKCIFYESAVFILSLLEQKIC